MNFIPSCLEIGEHSRQGLPLGLSPGLGHRAKLFQDLSMQGIDIGQGHAIHKYYLNAIHFICHRVQDGMHQGSFARARRAGDVNAAMLVVVAIDEGTDELPNSTTLDISAGHFYFAVASGTNEGTCTDV